MSRPLVIGIGSPNGDDQAGWLAVRALRQRLPPGVADCIACPTPTALLSHLPAPGRLLILDALRAGTAPGTVHILTWDAATGAWPAAGSLSSHGVGLMETLRLAEALGLLPTPPQLYGVELDRLDGAPGEALRTGVERLVEDLQRELAGDPRPWNPAPGALH